jgi:hypothetical protein
MVLEVYYRMQSERKGIKGERQRQREREDYRERE